MDQAPIAAVMSTYSFFRITEGPDSTRSQAIIQLLLSKELRSELHLWYRDDQPMNNAFREFKQKLSNLAGEELGK